MKIKKQLVEQKLHEAEQDVISTNNSAAEIKQAVKAAETTPYQLAGVRPQAGALFTIEA